MTYDKEQRTTVSTTSTSTAPSLSVLMRFFVPNARFAVDIFDSMGYFGMWQGKVLDVLFQQGLDIAIEEEKPDEIDDKEWKTINRLACGTIRSCLSREQKYLFSKETFASKLWKALEDKFLLWKTLEAKFLKKSGHNKLYMKKKLFRFSYQPGTTMNDHITAFNKTLVDLMNLDETFKDEDLALMLLFSLPDEYAFIEAMLLHGKEKVSLSEVCSSLYGHELRKKDKEESKQA